MNQQLPLPPAEEIHLQDYLNVIARRRGAFITSSLSVFAGVALFTFLSKPVYESSATLFVKDDKGKVGQMGDLLLNNATPVDSELEILKSRSNMEKVVSRLHLDWKVDKRSDGVELKLLEFASTLKEPVYRVEVTGPGSYSVKDDDGNLVGTGTSGKLLRAKGLSLLLGDLKGEKGGTFRLTLLPFNGTVEALRKQIKAEEVGKKTNVIGVTYRDHDADLARDVVNTLVQTYLDQGLVLRAEEATRTVGFVEEQLQGIKKDLEGAEQNLEAYKSASGVIQLDAEAQNLISTLSDAERQRALATLQRKQAEFALTSLKDTKRRGGDYSPSIMREDPILAGMASKLAELQVLRKGQLSENTGAHPGVKSVQAQIDELERKIQSTYETTLRNTEKQERDITGEIARHDAQLKKLPAAERDLARLTRLAKVNADIYTFLLQKHEEARIAKASTINNISVLDPAITADKPVSPKKRKNLALGLIVGLMSGIGLCFFKEYLDDTLKEPEEAQRALSLPLLAVVPHISQKEGALGLVSHLSPKSLASEAFRALRTGLHFCAVKKEKKVMLVTSTIQGEGKSTVSSNLAITLAQTGARVLLVDCDLRRSSLHEKFGCERGYGLTGVLAGDTSTAAAIHATDVSGLDLMTAGVVPPNPAELLGSDAMQRMIEELRGMYDYIVLDAPPALAVTDASVLTLVSDVVLMVLQAGRVPAKAAQRAKDVLLSSAAPVAGFVMSDPSSNSHGYGYGYKYGYGYGYDDGSDTQKKPWWRII